MTSVDDPRREVGVKSNHATGTIGKPCPLLGDCDEPREHLAQRRVGDAGEVRRTRPRVRRRSLGQGKSKKCAGE